MTEYEQMDSVNVEEMTNGLCRAGEACFARGEFKEAIDLLLRCIKAPHTAATRLSEAKSGCILGMIYGYLGQEMLAKEHLSRGLQISCKHGYEKEVIACYIGNIFFHFSLKDYEQALDYVNIVMPLIETFREKEPETGNDMAVTCLAYHGLICDRMGQIKQGEEILAQIEQLADNHSERSHMVPVLDLQLRLYCEKQETEKFAQCLEQLLKQPVPEKGFFETLVYYSAICEFLLEKGKQKEVRALLDYVKSCCADITLVYLKYNFANLELAYEKAYGGEESQWRASEKLLEMFPEYEAEQHRMKMYSFDYIEYLHRERDISAKMEQKSKLDPMTGLYNKFTIEFLVDEYFSQMDENGIAALLILDMDHFKQINDTLGHLVGDTILTDTAGVIKRFFQEDALCGRVGGDEFMVFVKDVQDVSTMLLQTEFLRQEIAKTTSERNITISIQASVGVAVSTAGFRDYTSMFNAADEALYRAKKEGRNRICVVE